MAGEFYRPMVCGMPNYIIALSLSIAGYEKKLSLPFVYIHRYIGDRQLTAHERCIFGSEFILLFELKKF